MTDASDLEGFRDSLDRQRRERAELRDYLAGEGPVLVTRAPGRLDVMGGIADYSGATVLQLPIEQSTFCAAQARSDGAFHVASLGPELRTFELESGRASAALAQRETARRFFARRPEHAWAGYVLGILAVWREREGFEPSVGADLVIGSSVPEGAGVSSSAALEVATGMALAHLLDRSTTPVQLALDCQEVENLVVGAPCGVMDQMTAACGRAHHLVELLCQPAELRRHHPVPDAIRFWGIDSGMRHAVSGADYTSVRVAAFMGHRILLDELGLLVERGPVGVQVPEDPWRGYLANVPADRFQDELVGVLPETMKGADFLAAYGGTIDPVTRVGPELDYPVRAATAHPIFEQERILLFRDLLATADNPRVRRALGDLMAESHASYSACGLGSAGTDRLVALVVEAGPDAGLHGAKITGGGSGGTVAVLGDADAGEAVAEVARRYGEETGRSVTVFAGSSSGAAEYGVRPLQP